MPTLLPNLSPESWKYSNITAALKKLHVVPAPSSWELTGVYEFVRADVPHDTLHIVIPAGRHVTVPLEALLRGHDGAELAPRVIVEVGAGAYVTLFERQTGEGAYWKNSSITITIAANAVVKHYRLVADDPFSVARYDTEVVVARDAQYHFVNIVRDCGFVRGETRVRLTGAGGIADLAGITLLRGSQHGDTTICVEHEAPHCTSSQFFRTIIDDSARGVFQGKIHVHKDAQKTDGFQRSNTLLLSPLAEMDVKPELEIYADDVKCSHGSTTGELDETPLFYLMSRGIPKEDARRMLLESFIDEIVVKIEHEAVATVCRAEVVSWLR